MHKAPRVDSGEMSTIDEPTLMLRAIASALPPFICSTNFVAVGKNGPDGVDVASAVAALVYYEKDTRAVLLGGDERGPVFLKRP